MPHGNCAPAPKHEGPPIRRLAGLAVCAVFPAVICLPQVSIYGLNPFGSPDVLASASPCGAPNRNPRSVCPPRREPGGLVGFAPCGRALLRLAGIVGKDWPPVSDRAPIGFGIRLHKLSLRGSASPPHTEQTGEGWAPVAAGRLRAGQQPPHPPTLTRLPSFQRHLCLQNRPFFLTEEHPPLFRYADPSTAFRGRASP